MQNRNEPLTLQKPHGVKCSRVYKKVGKHAWAMDMFKRKFSHITSLIHPIINYVLKNGHPKDACHDEIG